MDLLPFFVYLRGSRVSARIKIPLLFRYQFRRNTFIKPLHDVPKFPEILFHCHKLLVAELFIGFRFQLGIIGVKPFWLFAQGFG